MRRGRGRWPTSFRSTKPSTTSSTLHFFAGDLVRQLDDFGDRGRAGGNRLHHVFQAAFDTLGDLDLAFAGQQRDRAHFAHVHADRVGGAAEVGVDGRQRGGGSRFDFVVGGGGRHVIGQQQHFGVRGALVHRDAHVVEGGDDAFDRFRIDDVLWQLVVDLGVGQEAAVLAHVDQVLDLLAAALQVRFADLVVRQQARQAGLGLALARLGHRFQFGALDRVQRRDFVVLRHELARLAAAAARHLHARQQVAGGVDRGQCGGVGGGADCRRRDHRRGRHRLVSLLGAGAGHLRRWLQPRLPASVGAASASSFLARERTARLASTSGSSATSALPPPGANPSSPPSPWSRLRCRAGTRSRFSAPPAQLPCAVLSWRSGSGSWRCVFFIVAQSIIHPTPLTGPDRRMLSGSPTALGFRPDIKASG